MKRTFLLIACLLATLFPAPPAPAASFPMKVSPPGQIYVVSANAWQRKVIGVKRFEMMLELARAVLRRPTAFDSGPRGAGSAPDIIVMQEMQPANLEIFANLLRQRSDVDYQIVGSTAAFGKFIINTETLAMQGEAHVWNDLCYAAAKDADGQQMQRLYQWGEFIELQTGTRFTASSIHLDPRYTHNTGQRGCFEKNVPEIKRQMDLTDVPALIAGDFNRRAVTATYECDPEEDSAPLEWYSMLTAPATGRAYSDSVKDFHRQHGLSMATEWTHEQKTATVICDASTRFRRNRIDYLFTAGMETAGAHTDHPGWSGEEPGTRDPVNPRYSDHRFISGRFKLVGPAQPAAPVALPGAGGVIDLSWAAPETPVAEWLLYRAAGAGAYKVRARFPGEVLTFRDQATAHGRSYRYALAAVDANGAQGIESAGTVATADARGPKITSRSPGRNGTGIERRADIIVRYDEWVDPTSVSSSTMNLYKKGRRLCGSITQQTRRVLALDPCFPLGKKKTYKVVVYGVADKLGNRGIREEWTFTTR